jgi:tRNA (guanine-N1)-methyltransferase
MRLDIVSIFPDYLAPLELSLVGKAVRTGIVELGVHDLRQWTHDRHRTVDDTPYGGGAGMVMKPDPWGEALDALVPPGATEDALLLVMTPSGRRFDQALAAELAREQHLVIACGRYEGIDARVVEHARSRMRVLEVSIGDYVLNGGEAAALVVTEAVVRLLPGVIGNPESLTEESHAAGHDGLLEYPLYTKPPSWRGLDVPAVLFSGAGRRAHPGTSARPAAAGPAPARAGAGHAGRRGRAVDAPARRLPRRGPAARHLRHPSAAADARGAGRLAGAGEHGAGGPAGLAAGRLGSR